MCIRPLLLATVTMVLLPPFTRDPMVFVIPRIVTPCLDSAVPEAPFKELMITIGPNCAHQVRKSGYLYKTECYLRLLEVISKTAQRIKMYDGSIDSS